jgi:hypothetical protein
MIPFAVSFFQEARRMTGWCRRIEEINLDARVHDHHHAKYILKGFLIGKNLNERQSGLDFFSVVFYTASNISI